jgi:hypothetical protein
MFGPRVDYSPQDVIGKAADDYKPPARAPRNLARYYDQVIRRSSCACIRQGCVGTTRTLKP